MRISQASQRPGEWPTLKPGADALRRVVREGFGQGGGCHRGRLRAEAADMLASMLSLAPR
jgi:hypothetical protein